MIESPGGGYEIIKLPIDERPSEVVVIKKDKRKDFKITPQFIPAGWRVLRPREEVEEGDYRWKKIKFCTGHYVPATKIGDMVGFPIVYIRRIDDA